MPFTSRYYGNAYGMHYTFVGNIDVENAKPLLEKYLGSLPSTPKENKFKDNGIRMVKGSTEANLKKGKESQSHDHILCLKVKPNITVKKK